MKDYFIKFLPEGQNLDIKIPYMCSKNIQVGDTFINPRWGVFGIVEHVCTKIEMGSGENYYPKELLIWITDKERPNTHYWFQASKCYKLIGKMDSSLTFVDGEEFDRNDFECIWENKNGDRSFTMSDIDIYEDDKPFIRVILK